MGRASPLRLPALARHDAGASRGVSGAGDAAGNGIRLSDRGERLRHGRRSRGRSARVVVTMGMPAIFHRLWYMSHGIAGMRRNILSFVGIRPVAETLFGLVEGAGAASVDGWRNAGRPARQAAIFRCRAPDVGWFDPRQGRRYVAALRERAEKGRRNTGPDCRDHRLYREPRRRIISMVRPTAHPKPDARRDPVLHLERSICP